MQIRVLTWCSLARASFIITLARLLARPVKTRVVAEEKKEGILAAGSHPILSFLSPNLTPPSGVGCRAGSQLHQPILSDRPTGQRHPRLGAQVIWIHFLLQRALLAATQWVTLEVRSYQVARSLSPA